MRDSGSSMPDRFTCICILAVLPGFVQAQSVPFTRPYRTPLIVTGPPAPSFELRADTPAPDVKAGYASATRNTRQPYSSGHRYFYNSRSHIYFGYDLVMEPDAQADTYRVTFYDISVGPLDWLPAPTAPADPAAWKKLPLPAVPDPMVMHNGDTVSIAVFLDPDTQETLTDFLTVQSTVQDQRGPVRLYKAETHAVTRRGPRRPKRRAPRSSDRRAIFRWKMRCCTWKNSGEPSAEASRDNPQTGHVSNGPLVWFYAPGHGRYVLSLAPRRELKFVKAGDVRGGRDQLRYRKRCSPPRIGPRSRTGRCGLYAVCNA